MRHFLQQLVRASRVARLQLAAVTAAIAAALAPAKISSAQCDAFSNLRGVTAAPGVNGTVNSMTMWDPDGAGGTVGPLEILAGSFDTAGPLTGLHGFVGWDGAQFVTVPSLSTTSVDFVGTWRPDSNPATNPWLVQVSSGPDPTLAIYNGTNWSNVTQFVGGQVTAITSWDPDGAGPLSPWLIVAGVNLRLGTSIGPCNLLRFNGSDWANIGTISGGSYNRIYALTTWDPDGSAGSVYNDCLVIAGSFDHLGFPGGGGLSAVGNIGYYVYSPAAAGGFVLGTMHGGCTGASAAFPVINAVQAWDAGGTTKRLVIGGNFNTAGGASGANGLVWYSELGATPYFAVEGTSQPWAVLSALNVWDPDGALPGGTLLVVAGYNPSPYGAGIFSITPQGGVTLMGGSNIVGGTCRTLGNWDAAGNGAQPQWIIAGGVNVGFNSVARVGAGTQWLPLPNVGPDLLLGQGSVNAVASVSNLATTNANGTFIGGSFDYADNTPVNNVAVWNGVIGTQMGSVGAGLDGPINSFTTFRATILAPTVLYAGGAFTHSGATAINRFALLSGGPLGGYTWQSLGSGLNGNVNALTVFDPDGAGSIPNSIILGGPFTANNGVTMNRIAAYSPTTAAWNTLGTGFNNDVNALVVWDPDGAGPLPARLVAGGYFTTASGINISHLAYWDGIQWQPFEGGAIDGPVQSLLVWPDPAAPSAPRLVVGGTFAHAGGTAANNIAVWRTGSGWDASMGSGVNGAVTALTTADLDGPNTSTAATTTLGEELIIGGTFSANLQGDPLGSIANWNPLTQRWAEMGGLGSFNSSPPAVRVLRHLSQNAGERPRILIGGRFTVGTGGAIYNQRGLAVWTGTTPYVSSVPAPAITACGGDTVNLPVTVLGDNLVYRWQRNGVNLNNGPTGAGSSLSGVDTPSLTITAAAAADSGSYSCNVFSPCVNVTTTASALTVGRCCTCYANCDCSTIAPALNVLDFACFLNAFASGDPYANCDGSTTPPVLNVLDFACFLNQFAGGCP